MKPPRLTALAAVLALLALALGLAACGEKSEDATVEAEPFSLTLDFYATLIVGALSDNVAVDGFDGLDDENWTDWLIRHGIHHATLQSPVVMITVNICYQSPNGDTSRAARMAAGVYVD